MPPRAAATPDPGEAALSALAALLRGRPGVEGAWLFGSRARGDGGPRSDLDVAVLAPSMPPASWHALLAEVEEGLPTLLAVDLVRLDDAPEALRAEVARDGRRIA